MKNQILKSTIIILVIILGMLLKACGNSNLKDISADPTYAHFSNNIFFTSKLLYYYQYNKNGGITTDHFLSLRPKDSNGTKIQKIPKGSHIKISKVYEITLEDGTTSIWITGEIFPNPQQPLPYETPLIEETSFFEQRK